MTCSCNTPSTRCRIRNTLSSGSMCISDARTCTASSNMDCSSLTTGASLSSTSRLNASKSNWPSVNSSSSSSAKLAISSVRRYTRSSVFNNSLSFTSASWIGCSRIRSSSSVANISIGSAIPIKSSAPWSAKTMAR